MYFKTVESNGYKYLRLVEAYRNKNDKPDSKTIANLGRLDILLQTGQIEKLGKKLLTIAGVNSSDIKDAKEKNNFCYGDIIYRKIWNKYKLTDLLKKILNGKKIQYDFINILYLLVIDRLLSPKSKLSCYNNQDRYINIDSVELHHIYRSLDILSDSKDEIEQYIFEINRNLFNMKVDIIFYDVTTFHFESVTADTLKEFGFSKDGKFNEVQVVMGLIVDMEGRPIGFDLFPGNSAESKTFIETLNKLNKDFSIRKLVFVADKALNSKENLHYLKNAGYDYIVSSRLKNSTKKIQNEVFNTKNYKEQKNEEGQVSFKYKIIPDNKVHYRDKEGQWHSHKDNLIITWSLNRATRDKKLRERKVKKAENKIEKNQKPNNNKGYERYIALKGEQEIIGLDKEKIKKDSLWDGYYGIQTTEKKFDAQKVAEIYHHLWRIEETIKIIKSTIRSRPVFVWTPNRIKGHFVMCFIALVLERELEIRLRKNKIEYSPEKIKEALASMELREVDIKGEKYYFKSTHKPLASKLLKIFRIRHLKNVIPKEEFKMPI